MWTNSAHDRCSWWLFFCLAVTVVWGHRTNQMKTAAPTLEGYVFTNPVATGRLALLGAYLCIGVLGWFCFSGAICSGKKWKVEKWSQFSLDISKDEYLWRISRQSFLSNSRSKEPRKSFRVANRRSHLQKNHKKKIRRLCSWERRGIIINILQVYGSQHCTEVSFWDNAWKSKSKASNTCKVWMIKVNKKWNEVTGIFKSTVDKMKEF